MRPTPALLSLPSLASLALLAFAARGSAQAPQFVDFVQSPIRTLQRLPGSSGSSFAVPADVDADGDIDFLVRTGTVMRNLGDLQFEVEPYGTSIPQSGPLLLGATFQHVGDLDGDGLFDLVQERVDLVGGVTSFAVAFGRTGGTWLAMQVTGTAPGFLFGRVLADIDGDQRPDLVCSSFFTPGAILRNNGFGGFVDVTATHLPPNVSLARMAAGDLDGDGDLDLVASSQAAAAQVLRNDGLGHFTPHPVPSLPQFSPPGKLLLGDLDGDGDLDLLFGTFDTQPMQAFVNDGTGRFTAAAGAPALPPMGLVDTVVRDLDGSGRADLLAVDEVQDVETQLRVFHDPFAAAAAPTLTTIPGQPLGYPELVDLDGDGDLDVEIGGFLLLDDGTQHYQSMSRQPAPDIVGSDAVTAGDFDNDGLVDLLVGGQLLRGEGDGHFPVASPLPAACTSHVAFDADNDGDLDVAFAVGLTGGGLLENRGGTFVPGQVFTPAELSGTIQAADFDGDGRIDLYSSAGTLLQNAGGNLFTPAGTVPAPLFDVANAVADFDADGRPDIAVLAGATVTLLRNAGAFAFTPQGTASAQGAIGLAAGDLDGDGLPDIALIGSSSGFGGTFPLLTLLHQQNLQLQYAGTTFTSYANPSIRIVDVDADGDLDIVAGELLRNLGGGAFANSAPVTAGTLAIVDVDGDEDPDVVSVANGHIAVAMNRHRQLSVPYVPRIGAGYVVEVASRPGYGPATAVQIALSAARIAPLRLPGLGLLHLDLSAAFLGPIGITGTDGLCRFTTTVPRDPALAGVDVFWQGIVTEGGGAHLTGFFHDQVLR